MEALQRGGSAVDAAIAANAVLCVAYPHMAGLGGDGFWLLAGGGIEGVEAIDASGPAAAAATLASYRARSVDGAIPARGALAALTVPGAVDGWRLAHERHGKLAWASLFDAAIGLARDGVPVSRSVADWTAQDESLLRAQPRTAAIFLPGGGVPKDGDRMPIALASASDMSVSAMPMIMAVAMGTSASFLTPFANGVSLTVYGPGGYRFGDYWRIGIPVLIWTLAVTVAVTPLVWPFHP